MISSGMKTALAEAASWVFAGFCLIGTVVYFDELKAAVSIVPKGDMTARAGRTTATPQGTSSSATSADGGGYMVELAAGAYGHYRTSANVNGRDIDVLVDTGASFVALTFEDAERGGIFVTDADFKHRSQTANGISRVALVTIDRLRIGDIEVRDVRAAVSEPGKLNVTLLGMSFLGRLRRAEMRSGRLILEN